MGDRHAACQTNLSAMPGLYEWFVALGPDEFQDFTKRKLSDESICRLSGTGKHMQELFDLVHTERYVVDLKLKMRKKRSVCSKEADSIRDKKKRLKREKVRVKKIDKRENYALEKRETKLKKETNKTQKKRSICSNEADSIRDNKKRLKREKVRVEKKEERENYALEKRETELTEKMIKLQEEGEQITQVETMIANDMIETIWDAKDNRPAVCVWD